MAEIIDLSDIKEFKLRELEKFFEKRMEHHDSVVLVLWKELAKESLRKYPGAPTPLENELKLELPECVSDEQKNNIVNSGKDFLSNYQNIMLNMLGDIVVLQKSIAEDRARSYF